VAGGGPRWRVADRESELKGGSIGTMYDGLGFIHSDFDAVLYAVIDSVLLELIIL
jgi:hypothetical protein